MLMKRQVICNLMGKVTIELSRKKLMYLDPS